MEGIRDPPHCTDRDLLTPDVLPFEQVCKLRPKKRSWGGVELCGERSDGCSHCGRFASPIVAQEGGDVALVEVQAKSAQRWLRVARKALFQAAYGDPRNQAGGCLLHQN